jgi:hypothetical protein
MAVGMRGLGVVGVSSMLTLRELMYLGYFGKR